MTSPSLATGRPRRYRGLMMLRVSSLRAAHLVLWSSPILLLVLVFTVSSPPTVVARAPMITSRDAARIVRPKPTKSTKSTTSHRSTTPSKPLPTTTSTVTTPSANATAKSVSPSATTTDAIVPAPVSSLIGGAASGALVGDLPSADATDEVPMQGPGTWTVQSSAPMFEQLNCSGSTIVVGGSISIDALTTCRLLLTSQSVEPVRWQIVPTP